MKPRLAPRIFRGITALDSQESDMSRKWRYLPWIYLVGALVVDVLLMLQAYASGAFQSSHDAAGLLVPAALYLLAATLWPLLIVVGALQYVGLFPHPITF